MVLPAKIKNALPEGSGDELVVRRGFEPCLGSLSDARIQKDFFQRLPV